MKVLVYDFETGGLDPLRHSCLTLGAVFVDLSANIIMSEHYYQIKDKPYAVTPEALRINGINLTQHDREATWPYFVLDDLCERMQRLGFRESGQTVAAGHNVKFDREFMRRLARAADKPNSWVEAMFSRHICTFETVGEMMRYGHIPKGSRSLGNICSALNIEIRKAHNAKEDALATAKLLLKIKEHVHAYRDHEANVRN